MRHFTGEEWLAFKNDECTPEKFSLMEDHLEECEKCLETFLSTIDQAEIARAEECIPADFTAAVLKALPDEDHSLQERNTTGTGVIKRQRLFVYYAAAAVLTLAFTGGGFFQALVDSSSTVHSISRGSTNKIEQKLDLKLSQEIACKTNQLLVQLENHGQKED
jgi:anti-sigma factor RsiW